MSQLVSIIIPVYNTEKYIGECLDSIIGQSYKNFEVLIIDDESTDNSMAVAKKKVKRDKRFRFYQQKHQGQGVARNLGIKQARGSYLSFIDSDDYVDKDFLSKLYLSLKENKSRVACATMVVFKLVKGEVKKEFTYKFDSPNSGVMLKNILLDKDTGSCCPFLFERSLWDNVSFIESYFEDIVGRVEMLAKNEVFKTSYSGEVNYYARIREDSTTNRITKKFIMDKLLSIQLIKKILIKNNIFFKYEDYYTLFLYKHLIITLNLSLGLLSRKESRLMVKDVQKIMGAENPKSILKFRTLIELRKKKLFKNNVALLLYSLLLINLKITFLSIISGKIINFILSNKNKTLVKIILYMIKKYFN